MAHDTTSDETTEELNAGCGGGNPYYPDACIPPQYNLFAKLF